MHLRYGFKLFVQFENYINNKILIKCNAYFIKCITQLN